MNAEVNAKWKFRERVLLAFFILAFAFCACGELIWNRAHLANPQVQ